MEKKRLIIGFSGHRGVGKTTVMAQYLNRLHGFKVVSFGSKLKEMARLFFPFGPLDFLEKNKEKPYKEYDWTPRDFMIALGKLGRYFDENYWVKMSGLETMKGNIVLDDVRFPNEAEYIKSQGGILIRVSRYEKLNVYGKDLDDPSETSLDKYDGFDYRIESCRNTNLDDAHDALDHILEDLRDKGYDVRAK